MVKKIKNTTNWQLIISNKNEKKPTKESQPEIVNDNTLRKISIAKLGFGRVRTVNQENR